MNDDVRRAALVAASRAAGVALVTLPLPACAPDPAPPHANPPHWSCDALIEGAFPVEGKYPPEKRSVTPEVARCCTERLEHDGSSSKQRWSCCGAYEEPADPQKRLVIEVACTPWGPPVPPRA
jgi:hypothetical protein